MVASFDHDADAVTEHLRWRAARVHRNGFRAVGDREPQIDRLGIPHHRSRNDLPAESNGDVVGAITTRHELLGSEKVDEVLANPAVEEIGEGAEDRREGDRDPDPASARAHDSSPDSAMDRAAASARRTRRTVATANAISTTHVRT